MNSKGVEQLLTFWSDILRYGGGRHAILLHEPIKFAKVRSLEPVLSNLPLTDTTTVQAVLAAEALYSPAIGLVKISTCFLFARIFPQPKFRWFLFSLGAFVALYSTIQIIISIFQCRPINGAWDVSVGAQCIQISLVWEIMGGFNVLTDFALLLAPIPQLLKLQMPRQTKVQLVSLFSVGGL